ncbi:HPP family protein [Sphingomonas sp. NCPPB 2930]
MFYIYGLNGRSYSGPAEGLPPVEPVRRVQAPESVRVFTSPQDENTLFADPRPRGGLAQDAVAAYAQQAQQTAVPRVVRLVSELMQKEVVSVQADALLADAAQWLADHRIGQAPVRDEQRQLVGLLTRTGLLQAGAAAPDATVRAHMVSPVPAVAPDTDVRRVAQVLIDSGLPGLPVVEADGALCGFIARGDLLRAMATDPPLDLWS